MATRLRLIANPVASMVAIAASQRVPQRVAALLAVMPQVPGRPNWPIGRNG